MAVTLAAWATSAAAAWWGWRALPPPAVALLALSPLVYFPVGLLVIRGEPLASYGVTLARPGRSLGLAVLCAAILLPAFELASDLYARAAALRPPRPGRPLFAWIEWLGTAPGAWPWVIEQFLWQLAVIAVAEELFYRGYLQGRLNLLLQGHRRIAAAPIGAAVPITAAAFALHHLVVSGAPQDLLVFFPALVFGWLREASGSLLAPALFHAACNVFAALVVKAPPG